MHARTHAHTHTHTYTHTHTLAQAPPTGTSAHTAAGGFRNNPAQVKLKRERCVGPCLVAHAREL